MSDARMGPFWDARAREDAYFFIDNRRQYGDPEQDSFWASGETDLDGIFELLGVTVDPAAVALDIGCGVGRLTRVLSRRASEVYGLDVSGEMIERAREQNAHLTNVYWLQGDGVSLQPLTDGSVDVCVSHVVFQHIPDPQITYGYMREIGRVLRPGGWAAFQVSNDPGVHLKRSRGRGLREWIAVRTGRRPAGQANPAWLGSAVDLATLRAAADEGQLDFEKVIGEGTQYCMILAKRRS